MDVIAEVERSGLVESRHRGVAVRVDTDGAVIWALGEPDTITYPRSTNKPFQAVAMLRAGLSLRGEQLAIATASHSAEPFHLQTVRAMLADAGLTEEALQTPPSYPADPKEHAAVLRAGEGRLPIRHDCSGKHAAMLRTCVERGWDPGTYLDPEHPLQLAITETFTELTGARPARIGIDGCGAPQHATSMRHLAMGIARIAAAPEDSEEGRLRQAMLDHPTFVSGTRRPELRFMTELPGVIAKSGAEALLVVGLPDATAIAVKIEDGADRPLYAVAGRAVQLAGWEAEVLTERPRVLGGGETVGAVHVTF
ncbi:asparaginase [Aeromicrobium sp. YIM 150415]|uniref:asparaginase n=1 Tax=Aeromicrobium sp. YIM 150415 TaxID=2803912 RepID=UPI001963E350|nr:asparaginase [Aeromicrobium sp. YIM 150415]MBM9464771.1 asparaginase [Aeromicrobium sp. YIM 150415]